MSKINRAIWIELAQLVPPRVVERSDRWTFEVLVCLMAKFRKGRAKGGEATQIINLLAKFGMTPSDRSRVSQGEDPENPTKKPADPWADFAPQRPQ